MNFKGNKKLREFIKSILLAYQVFFSYKLPIYVNNRLKYSYLININNIYYWCIFSCIISEFEYDCILFPTRQRKDITYLDGPPENINSHLDLVSQNAIIIEIKTRMKVEYTHSRQFQRQLQWSKMGIKVLYVSIEDTDCDIVFRAQRNLAKHYGQVANIWHCSFDMLIDEIYKIT